MLGAHLMQEGSGPCKIPNLSHLLWSYGTCMHGPVTKLSIAKLAFLTKVEITLKLIFKKLIILDYSIRHRNVPVFQS